MKKLLLSAVLGFALACAVFYVAVLPEVRSSWLAVGENNGSIAARYEIATHLKREFGTTEVHSCSNPRELFGVKTTSVVIVDCNGVKSIRVHE
jgi:hypothetical protein